ncbi:MAG: hypothetical protein EXS39_02125 [Opitutaceae bacterium]|nr:hypothetical protein [Opitutaceae bacterium]
MKDAAFVVDAPPDQEVDLRPEAHWPAQAVRTGVFGAVGPRVTTLPGGGYRLYYTQILPRPGFPAGANDYANSTTRILSAISPDGSKWTPEPGVRLSAEQGGAGQFRVVSSDVVPMAGGNGRLRMYYECCRGLQSETNSIRSAVSVDGGLVWTPEPGARLEASGCNFMSPRIIFLDGGRCRLYCGERDRGIISAISEDGGLTFRQEPGLRIAQDGAYDTQSAFAAEIMRIGNGSYVMYYAGYSAPNRAYILRAKSDDGLAWRKEPKPAIAPGHGVWDAAKCSEMCVFQLPLGEGPKPRYRIVYEACDGTAKNERGVWRIASATSAA